MVIIHKSLLPCVFYTGEIIVKKPKERILSNLGFRQYVAKRRTYWTKTFSFDYIDNQKIVNRMDVFVN